jgi:hypothetical protein
MNLSQEDRVKFRGYYNSLIRQERVLEGIKGPQISRATFEVIENVFFQLSALVQYLLPPLNRHTFDVTGSGALYDRAGVQAWVATAIGIAESVLEDAGENDPVTERLDFSFIRDKSLRSIVERDFIEAQRVYIADCWKSVIILSGGIIETMLLDSLLNDARAVGAQAAPNESDLNRWSLADLINVAVELKVVEPSVQALANPVREYRNLVHLGVERRKGIKPEKLEAESGLNILRIIQRDLSRAAVP